MKKQKYTLFSLLMPLLFFYGCYDDKGNYSYTDIGEAIINAIPGVTDQNDVFVCLENELVKLNPEMTFLEGTTAADYDFEWSRYFKIPQGEYGYYVQPEVIGTSMNLEYRIQETPLDYWAVFKVKNKHTGAITEHKFSFTISAVNGWFVLDEDATGVGDLQVIRDADIITGGNNKVVKDYFSANNDGAKIQNGKFLGYSSNSARKNMYVFSDNNAYIMDPATYKLRAASTYPGLFNATVGSPAVMAPEAHYFTTENGGFETIVNDGAIYYVAYMAAWGGVAFEQTTDVTGYKVAPILAPVRNTGGTRAAFFDLTGNRFMTVGLWGTIAAPQSSGGKFNVGGLGPDMKFVYLGEGKDGSTNAIMNKELADGGVEPYIFRVDLRAAEPVALDSINLSKLENIKFAACYAFGTRGDFMFYASGSNVYGYRYGKGSAFPVLEVGPGETIVRMKVYVNPADNKNNGKFLFVATNSGAAGKVYKLKFSEMTGMPSGDPLEYTGFGKIKDMFYKN